MLSINFLEQANKSNPCMNSENIFTSWTLSSIRTEAKPTGSSCCDYLIIQTIDKKVRYAKGGQATVTMKHRQREETEARKWMESE
jgi:hypothetical protein